MYYIDIPVQVAGRDQGIRDIDVGSGDFKIWAAAAFVIGARSPVRTAAIITYTTLAVSTWKGLINLERRAFGMVCSASCLPMQYVKNIQKVAMQVLIKLFSVHLSCTWDRGPRPGHLACSHRSMHAMHSSDSYSFRASLEKSIPQENHAPGTCPETNIPQADCASGMEGRAGRKNSSMAVDSSADAG